MSTLAEVNPRLKALTEAGVSVWLDQLGRSLVAGGELKRMVTQESLRGVTSNPSIFEKSILGTSDYDDAIEELARTNHSAKEIYDTLAIADVQAAADVLASVHESSDGRTASSRSRSPPTWRVTPTAHSPAPAATGKR